MGSGPPSLCCGIYYLSCLASLPSGPGACSEELVFASPHSENCVLPGSHAAPASRSLGKAEVLCCRRNSAQGLYLFLLSFHGLFPFLHLFS